jgi:anti-sigma factor (TIGR02949 family)
MNCQEALSLLYEIIDKEASEIDIRQVEEHLSHCHDCSGIYRLERSVNELIRERLQHQEVTPRLDSLKTKILTELDAIDCAHQNLEAPKKKLSEAAPPRAFPLGRTLAFAASVMVVIGAFFVGKSIFFDHATYLPLEQAHWAAVENLDDHRNSTVTTSTLVSTQQSLAYGLAEQIGSFTLVGGHPETVDNIPLAHFVYHNQNRIVSVFVIDADLINLADDLLETLVIRNGIEFYDHNCRGCRLVYHRVGRALIVTATTERDIELLDFVPDLGPV